MHQRNDRCPGVEGARLSLTDNYDLEGLLVPAMLILTKQEKGKWE